MLINLKRIREEKGFTLEELSLRTGISKGYLCHIENLTRKNPSFKIINKILEVLNISFEELIKKWKKRKK